MSEEKLTLGQYFKREREKREITLKEIEQTTKIPAQTLKFLAYRSGWLCCMYIQERDVFY